MKFNACWHAQCISHLFSFYICTSYKCMCNSSLFLHFFDFLLSFEIVCCPLLTCVFIVCLWQHREEIHLLCIHISPICLNSFNYQIGSVYSLPPILYALWGGCCIFSPLQQLFFYQRENTNETNTHVMNFME